MKYDNAPEVLRHHRVGRIDDSHKPLLFPGLGRTSGDTLQHISKLGHIPIQTQIPAINTDSEWCVTIG